MRRARTIQLNLWLQRHSCCRSYLSDQSLPILLAAWRKQYPPYTGELVWHYFVCSLHEMVRKIDFVLLKINTTKVFFVSYHHFNPFSHLVGSVYPCVRLFVWLCYIFIFPYSWGKLWGHFKHKQKVSLLVCRQSCHNFLDCFLKTVPFIFSCMINTQWWSHLQIELGQCSFFNLFCLHSDLTQTAPSYYSVV